MKRKAALCKNCNKPVYDLTGKNIPDHISNLTSKYQDYVTKHSDDGLIEFVICPRCYRSETATNLSEIGF